MTGRYPLGAALLHLGTSYLDRNELRSRAINWADPLAARSGLAVRIGACSRATASAGRTTSSGPTTRSRRCDIGELQPLHATALGKVLLATLPPPRRGCTSSAAARRTPRDARPAAPS